MIPVTKSAYGIELLLEGITLERAIERVKETLKAEGFGVLAEIDVAKTLKDKIGADIPAQVILGACNPHFAHQALAAEPNLALLLPCNVVVSAAPAGRVKVAVIDAAVMLSVVGNRQLDPVAAEINARLRRVLGELAAE